jgi:hypothetical protein
MASSRGVEVDGALATWSQLIKARREQRDVEFHVARARDLAHAYHCLDYYGRVYGEAHEERSGGDGYSPIPLIRRLAEEATGLGGQPGLLTFHTTYMRRGIEEALGVSDAPAPAAPPGFSHGRAVRREAATACPTGAGFFRRQI